MGVDKRSRYFAGGRHSTPGRADALVLQVRIAGDGQFAQNGAVMNWRDHFKRSKLWIRTVDIVATDDNVLQPFLPPLVGDVASEFIVAWGAGDVRFSGEDVMLAAFFVGGRNCFELDLDLSLVRGGRGSEAEDGSLAMNREARAEQDKIQIEQQDSQVLLLQFCRELPRRAQRRFAEVEVHSLCSPRTLFGFINLRQQIRLGIISHQMRIPLPAVVVEFVCLVVVSILHQKFERCGATLA